MIISIAISNRNKNQFTRPSRKANYVELSDENAINCITRILDLLDEDDDVQAVYHNWDE